MSCWILFNGSQKYKNFRNIYKLLNVNTYLSFSELFVDKNNLPIGWIEAQWKYESGPLSDYKLIDMIIILLKCSTGNLVHILPFVSSFT